MPFLTRLLLIAICGAAWTIAPLKSMAAQSTIRVVVNGEIITSYDVAQRTKILPLFGIKGGQKKATEELIDEMVKVQEARKWGIRISDAQVDGVFASMGRERNLSPAQLSRELGRIGIDAKTMKRWIKAQMTWRQLVQAKVRREGQVKTSDIMTAMLEKGNTEGGHTETEFRLQQIIFVVPSGSSKNYVAQRRREAEAFRQRFPGCENSLAQAKSLKGVVVRDMGRRETSQLRGASGKEIQETAVGKTTRPRESEKGVELIAVCARRDFQSDAAARAEVESQLRLEQSKELAEDYLKELREAAIIQYN